VDLFADSFAYGALAAGIGEMACTTPEHYACRRARHDRTKLRPINEKLAAGRDTCWLSTRRA